MVDVITGMNAVVNAFFALSWTDVSLWVAYSLALVAYGVLIWHFYRFVAKRDLFPKDLTYYAPGLVGAFEHIVFGLLRFLKYGILFPVMTFFWFAGFTFLLFMVAKFNTIDEITVIAVALISAIRILAYYNEEQSKDFSKMIPFLLLAVFLTEPNFFSFSKLSSRLLETPILFETLLKFVVYLSALELALRILLAVKWFVLGKNPDELAKDTPVKPPIVTIKPQHKK